MSVSIKEKPRKRVIPPPDSSSIYTSIVDDDLEIARFPNGASIHKVRTSAISSNGSNSNSASSNGASADHTENEAKDEIITSYSINMNDIYRYGWRYLTEIVDDTIIITGQIPLTLEDLLHPEEEDFRMQNPGHTMANHYLLTVHLIQLGDEPNVLILHDTRVDWNVPGVRPFGPDITVIMDGRMEPSDKGTFVAGEDGTAPVMIIEVTSPSTRDQDFYDKPILMQQVGLPYYFVVDLATSDKRVYGYRLNSAGRYVGIRPDAQGRVWMEPVGMWLGLLEDRVECYDAQGELILTYSELAQALAAAQIQADEEAQMRREADERAQAEAQRADEEAQMRMEADERAQAETRRADEEAHMRSEADERAQAEARRADEEAQMRSEADEEIKNLQQARDAERQQIEAHLRALGIDPTTVLSS